MLKIHWILLELCAYKWKIFCLRVLYDFLFFIVSVLFSLHPELTSFETDRSLLVVRSPSGSNVVDPVDSNHSWMMKFVLPKCNYWKVWHFRLMMLIVLLVLVVNGVVTNNGTGNSGRGRFQLGRGVFRNDNFRGRGSFSSNMGYRRNEFRNRAEYSGHGWGQGFRGSDGYQQRTFQNGDGMIVGRPRGGGPKITAVSA